MKVSGKVYARLLPLCLMLGLKFLQVSRALTWDGKLDMKWGRARTNWSLHLTLATSNLDNTGDLQDKWMPITAEPHMHLDQDSEKLEETQWAVEMLWAQPVSTSLR